MKLTSILLVSSVLALTGCTVGQSVPKLKLTVNPKTHEVNLQNPKDTTIKNFHAEVTTNGTSIVTFDQLTTVMNPEVITTTGDAQAKMIKATGDAVTQALTSAGAVAGAALKTP